MMHIAKKMALFKHKILKRIFLVSIVFMLIPGYGAELLNGGFENPPVKKVEKGISLKLADKWTVILNSGRTKTAGELSSDAHSGKKAVKLTAKEAKAYVGIYQKFDCKPDTELKISSWMKGGKQRCAAFYRIFFVGRDGKKSKKYLMPGWVLGRQWKLYEYKFRVPPEAIGIHFGIETLNNKNPDAEVFIDDVKVEETAGPVLKNAVLRVEIDPLSGGSIRSFEFFPKGNKVQFTMARSINALGGMALDIIPARHLPGFFANKKYDLKVIEAGKRICVSRVEKGGALDGLKISKTFELGESSSKVDVKLELTNTSSRELPVTIRVQNILAASEGFFTSPTRDWLQVFHKTRESIKTTNALESNNLQAGWLAKTTPEAALLFEFELKQAAGGYSWTGNDLDTVEWYYTPIKLAPGESWNTNYSIHAAASNQPVFAFDGKIIYGVDSLNSGKGKTLSAAASVPAVLNGTVNGRKTNVKLDAAGVSVIPLTGSSAVVTNGKFNAVLGTKHNYPPQFIRGIRLPAPKAVSKTRRFDDFFMFSFNDVSLTWQESTGVTGWSRQIISNAEHTMRENAANGFNLFMIGRVIQPDILPKAALPDGRNRIGELAVKYDLALASNTLLFKKNEIEVEKFRPALKKRLDYFYYPEYIGFMKRYDKQFKAVFSADETTGQNIPCMLEAHETLARRLPIDLPIYPYLNIHTRVYIPYVPVFFGDWYPISRRDHGGRNPWSTVRVVAETVAKAKNVPVHVMLQCFGYFKKSYGLPTPEELRLMVNLAFACGAKGIDFHEVNNRGLSWRYNYGYHYTARGNAGELTPIWFTLGECARELTAIGPQAVCASVCPVPAWLKIVSPVYKSDNGCYNGPQIKFYTLKQYPEKGGSYIAAAVNHSEKNPMSADMTFPKEAGNVYSLTKMRPVSGRYKINLPPGGAEYFVMGSAENIKRISSEVALERAKREKVRFEIASERARINGVELDKALRSAEEAAACIARKDGLNALNKITAADTEMKKSILNSDFGKMDRLWKQVRMTLSGISFMFLTHFDLVIPPHLREKTRPYAKWNNTDDPQMQKHVDHVADCWTKYWQIEQAILKGALADPEKRAKIEKFADKALTVSKAAEKYLKANAHKIAVDDPYAE